MSEPPSQIRIALVEDVPELRATLETSLRAAPDMAWTGACGTGEEAVERIPAWRPDVVVMDIHLPGMNGVECVRRLKEVLPETEFLMLTIFEDHRMVFDSLAAGASGYLVKRSAAPVLLDSIRELHAGGSPMSPLIARWVVMAFRDAPVNDVAADALSARELEVLRLLSSGARYKEIGERLTVSAATVRNHLHRIYRKLQVRTKAEAVRRFRERGA